MDSWMRIVELMEPLDIFLFFSCFYFIFDKAKNSQKQREYGTIEGIGQAPKTGLHSK